MTSTDHSDNNGPRTTGPGGYGAGDGSNPRQARVGAPQQGYRPQPGQAAGARSAAPAANAPRQAGVAAGPPQQAHQPAPEAKAVAPESGTQVATAPQKNNKRVLTVGNDILLKGEIATCDRLVIEGMVDATLKEVHTVEISESGSFKGTAEIQDAEISGLFEGDLIVNNRLTIYSTGRVCGKISYGEIEIARGGQLTGEIRIGQESNAGHGEDKDTKAA